MEAKISRAFEQVGFRLILAGLSQAKGRIERLWRIFQDRLIVEPTQHDITEITESKIFLKITLNYNLMTQQKMIDSFIEKIFLVTSSNFLKKNKMKNHFW